MRVSCFVLGIGILGLISGNPLHAQPRSTGGTAGNQSLNQNQGSVSGQTGQSENFSVQRDTSAFIGGDTGNFFSGAGAGGATGLGNTRGMGGLGAAGLLGGFGGRGMGGNMGFGNQLNNQAGSTKPQIRFQTKLGFTHPGPAASVVSANIASRFGRIPQLPSASSVTVTLEDRTAILVGVVATERERNQMEKLTMMESGVSAVRNELTVLGSTEPLPIPGATN